MQLPILNEGHPLNALLMVILFTSITACFSAGADPAQDALMGMRLRAADQDIRMRISSPRGSTSTPRFILWLRSVAGVKEEKPNYVPGEYMPPNPAPPRPAPLNPPPPTPASSAPAPKPETAAVPAPVAPGNPRFPQCRDGKFTSDTKLAGEMFGEILKVENAFDKKMIEDIPFKGKRAKFSLISQADTLQIKIEASIKMTLPAKLCQQGADIKVLLDNSNATGFASFAGKTIELNIQPRNDQQFFISDPAGSISNTYSTEQPETAK